MARSFCSFIGLLCANNDRLQLVPSQLMSCLVPEQTPLCFDPPHGYLLPLSGGFSQFWWRFPIQRVIFTLEGSLVCLRRRVLYWFTPHLQDQIYLNILFFTLRFIETGWPSSNSTPDSPPSPLRPAIFRRSSSSISAMVFFFLGGSGDFDSVVEEAGS